MKSTENSFTKTEVKSWANELKEQRTDENCSLVLIGNIPPGIMDLDQVEGVIIETKNLDLPAFIEQAAQRLAKFLERENLPAGTGEQRESVVHALESKLQHYATEARRLSRDEFIRLLRTWIGSVPKTGIAAEISSIIKHAPDDLLGREDEMKLLHETWVKVQSQENGRARVLTFVALGGEGKTSLVAKWAAELANQGWPGCDTVFAWSFYSQGMRESASSDLFLKEALTFFGDTETANSSKGAYDKGRRLSQIVGERRALLILDGVEPLQYAPTSPMHGELKDQGVAALLKALSSNNHGLCVVTTRYVISDLRAFWQTTAPQKILPRLSNDAGVALLKSLGVYGIQQEFETLVEDVKGHALTLNLLGSYIRDAFTGDIRKRDLVKLEEADAEEQGGHAFRVIAAYVHWFQQEGDNGHRAVAVLRCLGLFDRPVATGCFEVLQKAPAISGMTKALVGISEAQKNMTLTRLEGAKLVSVNRDASGLLVSLDTHPLLREYFAQERRTQHLDAWRAAHRSIYEYLCATTPDKPDATLEDLQPLYQAVVHGCHAGMQQDACEKVYHARILRKNEYYSINKLGAAGSDLGAITCFFETPWSHISTALTERWRVWLPNEAAVRLRALGRLRDAIEPMNAGLHHRVSLKQWTQAAISASNASELLLSLGDMPEALRLAKLSVSYADRDSDGETRWWSLSRVTYATVLHQMGNRAEAEARFHEAEKIQAKSKSKYKLVYSLNGFQYCDLLLSSTERSVWQITLNRTDSSQPTGISTSSIPQRSAEDSSLHLQSCQSVFERAAQTLSWVEPNNMNILSIAFDHLTLGRTELYKAILNSSHFQLPAPHLEQAVSGLRRAGQQQCIPPALISRAWLRAQTGTLNGIESAQSDLDEAWEIAERGPMPLFQADIHLHRARLFFREVAYPWESPQKDLAEARRLIFMHGYLRRKEELEDAEAVIVK